MDSVNITNVMKYLEPVVAGYTLEVIGDAFIITTTTVVIISSLLNGFYLLVCAKSRKLRQPNNVMCIALSVVNLIVMWSMLINTFLSPQDHDNSSLMGIMILAWSNVWQSMVLLSIAVERFIAVVKPLHYTMIVTTKRLAIVIVATGVLSLAACLVLIATPQKTINDHILLVITEQRELVFEDLYSEQFVLLIQIWNTGQLVMGLCMIGVYIPVFVVIHRQRKQLRIQSRTSGSNMKGSIMLCVVIIIYLITWTPLSTFFLMDSVLQTPLSQFDTNQLFLQVAQYVVYTCFVLNPVLYGFSSKLFWKEVCKLCRPRNANTVEVAPMCTVTTRHF